MNRFTESTAEGAAFAWPEAIGWRVARSLDIAPDMPAAERRDYSDVVLAQRLRDALARLNPDLPGEAQGEAGGRRDSRRAGAGDLQIVVRQT